jgi:OmpA-OmpF porin, OOP family
MKDIKYKILSVCFLLLQLSVYAQNDVAGSKDDPLIPRYPGSVIIFYNETNNRNYELTLGPLVKNSPNDLSYTPTDTRTLSGKITTLQYMIKNAQFQDVVNFYNDAIKKNGFDLIAFTKSNRPMEVAGRNWTNNVYDKLPYKLKSNIAGTKGGEENRYYIVGQLNQPGQKVFAVMVINEFDRNEIYVHSDVIGEGEKIERPEETNAKTIENDLKEKGYSIINGIYFEQDKADIKEESGPALDEIAKYLKKNQGVILYVIGHTDMAGRLDFKIALSKSRADAVVKVLKERYSISSERLIPDGVGFLSPVASNQNLEGRKKNDRIELVLKSF